LSCRISGNAITFSLAGIFVSTVIAAAHIICYPGANAVGIDGALRAVFVFFTGCGQQANHCQSWKNKSFHTFLKTRTGPA
jgi:hypothetical protein